MADNTGADLGSARGPSTSATCASPTSAPSCGRAPRGKPAGLAARRPGTPRRGGGLRGGERARTGGRRIARLSLAVRDRPRWATGLAGDDPGAGAQGPRRGRAGHGRAGAARRLTGRPRKIRGPRPPDLALPHPGGGVIATSRRHLAGAAVVVGAGAARRAADPVGRGAGAAAGVTQVQVVASSSWGAVQVMVGSQMQSQVAGSWTLPVPQVAAGHAQVQLAGSSDCRLARGAHDPVPVRRPAPRGRRREERGWRTRSRGNR